MNSSSTHESPVREPSPPIRRQLLYVVTAVALVLSPFAYHVLTRMHGLEFPLDDAYIYLQYARNLAAGRLFEYWPGDGYTAGATSPLYPFLLVPGFWLGLEGAAMVPYGWLINAVLVGLCVWLAARIGRVFAGTVGAVACAGMLLIHGAWLWGAMSGLEIGMFTALALAGAWLLARDGAELAARDAGPSSSVGDRRPPAAVALWTVSALLAVARPEGMPMALLLVGAALLGAKRRWRWSTWLLWLPVVVPYLLVGFLNWHEAGQFVPNTAVHKSVLYFPRQSTAHVISHVLGRVVRLGSDLWKNAGHRWLLPLNVYTVLLAVIGLARPILGELRSRRAFPATWLLLATLAATAAAMVAKGPGSFNRYFHVPFAMVAVAAGLGLAELSRQLRQRVPLHRAIRLELAGVAVVLALGVPQLDRWSRVFARAAGEIRTQHVTAARWIDAHLPPDAYLLLNDVGAMTYLGNRRCYDLCGLTTNHQAMAYHEGRGALFEALERLEPARRPGYLAVYPGWLGIPSLEGKRLFSAKLEKGRVVAGGSEIVISELDWQLFGTGTRPASLPAGEIIDAVDVADLADEAAHHYVIEVPDEERGLRKQALLSIDSSRGDAVADGGRRVSGRERFEVTLPSLTSVHLGVRLEGPEPARLEGSEPAQLEGPEPARLEVWVDGARAGELAAPESAGFHEVDLALPSLDGRSGTHHIEVRASVGKPYKVFHYWVWGTRPGAGSGR